MQPGYDFSIVIVGQYAEVDSAGMGTVQNLQQKFRRVTVQL